jgi:hypothetical protein
MSHLLIRDVAIGSFVMFHLLIRDFANVSTYFYCNFSMNQQS